MAAALQDPATSVCSLAWRAGRLTAKAMRRTAHDPDTLRGRLEKMVRH
jgi:hypothetical protein